MYPFAGHCHGTRGLGFGSSVEPVERTRNTILAATAREGELNIVVVPATWRRLDVSRGDGRGWRGGWGWRKWRLWAPVEKVPLDLSSLGIPRVYSHGTGQVAV